jgi:adenosine/AMP kinase
MFLLVIRFQFLYYSIQYCFCPEIISINQGATGMELKTVQIDNANDLNFVLGQAHFIKTCEDVHEVLVGAIPGIKFGFAFCESSGARLIRYSGTDDELVKLAIDNMEKISAGHVFILFLRNAFPINILKTLWNVPEIVRFFCATANPVQVILAESEQGRGVLGVIDGQSTLGIETEEDIKERKQFLRKIGYKL